MRVLIAPDKFKGSLSSMQAANAIRAGIRQKHADWEIDIVPIADGGEGTARLLSDALCGRWLDAPCVNALGQPVMAGFGLALVDGHRVAVMEMSAASGIAMLSAEERDPWHASTLGTGQLLMAAVQAGADKIIVGIGGSATNDGGSGMALALGYQFLSSKDGEPLENLPADLMDAEEILYSLELDLPEIIVACDVENPLLGENGATQIYGPQKGITPDQLTAQEQRLEHLADLVIDLGHDFRDTPGAGAAGGLGFGLLGFAGATLKPGFDVVADVTGLREKIAAADLVITGEGSLDAQTLMGKGPAGVARLAKESGARVIAYAGRTSDEAALAPIFDQLHSIMGRNPGISEADAIGQAEKLLTSLVAATI